MYYILIVQYCAKKCFGICKCNLSLFRASLHLFVNRVCFFTKHFCIFQDKDDMLAKDPYGNLLNKGLVDLGFIHAFVASLSVIIVSELGDKTFFIAAIMAMRHPRLLVYLGAICALGFMTIMSGIV